MRNALREFIFEGQNLDPDCAVYRMTRDIKSEEEKEIFLGDLIFFFIGAIDAPANQITSLFHSMSAYPEEANKLFTNTEEEREE